MLGKCPFCDRGQFEERLIAEVGGFYIIATLGQITDGGYLLLFPAEHVLCMGALSEEQTERMIEISNKICAALVREFKTPVTMFEHGIVGQIVQHAYLHFLPVALNLTPRIKADFKGCRIREIRRASELRKIYSQYLLPYLFWSCEEVDSWSNVCLNPPAPEQYFRTVVAKELSRPERAHWRMMNQKLDKRLWSETVLRLRPYFK